MSLFSKVDSVKDILKNDSVSYGRKFIAKVKTKSATVPVGYADGISRNLTNSFKAIIKGKQYNQIGRITMDRISFNVSKGKIRVGDNVILLGKSKNIEINAWDWCKVLNTIPYEITCNISKRVPRIYKWN
jgi:alanine racemase